MDNFGLLLMMWGMGALSGILFAMIVLLGNETGNAHKRVEKPVEGVIMADMGRGGAGDYHGPPWSEAADLTPRVRELEAEVERLEKLIEPTEWKGWEQIDSIYEEARLLRKERDEARAEAERKEQQIQDTESAAKGEAARLRVENWQARQDVLRLREVMGDVTPDGELGVHDEQNARLASADREGRRKAGWFRRLLEWFRDPGNDDSNEPPTRDQLGREKQYFG